MRVQYGWLISFIVALVTFEELDYVFSCAHSDPSWLVKKGSAIGGSWQFEITLGNSLWSGLVQIRAMWLFICSGRRFEKYHTNVTNVTLHLLERTIWWDIWQVALEKNRRNVTFATLHLLEMQIYEIIWPRWCTLCQAKRQSGPRQSGDRGPCDWNPKAQGRGPNLR